MGLYLLSGAGSDFTLRGDGLVLLCAVAFAGHILVTARGVRDHDVGALLAVQLGLCGVVCLAIAGVAGDLEKPEGATVWSALLVTSLVASALGFFVQSYAQQHASPARTALILASEPAFAGFFGYVLADERLSAVSWIGAALILASIVVGGAAAQAQAAATAARGLAQPALEAARQRRVAIRPVLLDLLVPGAAVQAHRLGLALAGLQPHAVEAAPQRLALECLEQAAREAAAGGGRGARTCA